MKLRGHLLLSLVFINTLSASAQDKKSSLYFDIPAFSDTSSTVMIPIQYSDNIFSSDKLAVWGSYYANIIFYDYTTDQFHRLFDHNTYIEKFGRITVYDTRNLKYKTDKWIFYQVRDTNRSGNRRIDTHDPAMLYVSDVKGYNLKRLTAPDENVLSYELYEKQGFMLVKMQRDEDKDGKFTGDDKDYYYISVNLSTLKLGNRIELMQP